MEYQKIRNLLDDITNEPSKFRSRNWVEINYESRGTYNASNQIIFKTSMIRSNLCNYSDAYMYVTGTKKFPNTGIAAATNNRNKKVIIKNCAPFSGCISETNNMQIVDDHISMQ